MKNMECLPAPPTLDLVSGNLPAKFVKWKQSVLAYIKAVGAHKKDKDIQAGIILLQFKQIFYIIVKQISHKNVK